MSPSEAMFANRQLLADLVEVFADPASDAAPLREYLMPNGQLDDIRAADLLAFAAAVFALSPEASEIAQRQATSRRSAVMPSLLARLAKPQ